LSAKRLGKCHPFHKMRPGHGFDPVPLEVCAPPWYAPWRVSSAPCAENDAHV
jgi:putative component of membrane protein insertase Oxa1/YidC/SpoIIIJ protein YidD